MMCWSHRHPPLSWVPRLPALDSQGLTVIKGDALGVNWLIVDEILHKNDLQFIDVDIDQWEQPPFVMENDIMEAEAEEKDQWV